MKKFNLTNSLPDRLAFDEMVKREAVDDFHNNDEPFTTLDFLEPYIDWIYNVHFQSKTFIVDDEEEAKARFVDAYKKAYINEAIEKLKNMLWRWICMLLELF